MAFHLKVTRSHSTLCSKDNPYRNRRVATRLLQRCMLNSSYAIRTSKHLTLSWWSILVTCVLRKAVPMPSPELPVIHAIWHLHLVQLLSQVFRGLRLGSLRTRWAISITDSSPITRDTNARRISKMQLYPTWEASGRVSLMSRRNTGSAQATKAAQPPCRQGAARVALRVPTH